MAKSAKSVKRFGTRYGKTVKDKYGKQETLQRKSYKCPHCSRESVKRLAAGIWNCEKCGVKFASKAYTVGKLAKIQTKVEEL